MITALYKKLIRDLSKELPTEQIIKDDLLIYAYGVDASFYSLTPKIVIIVENENEVIQVLTLCRKFNIPFTFRAAGTSLSGQAVTDSILIKLGKKWNKITVKKNGSVVKIQPGAIGAAVNKQLSLYNRKLGPDPASINIAKMGGIIANNASGMTSGVVHNAYNTLLGMRIVFQDGTILDTNEAQSRAAFLVSHKNLIDQILSLSKKVKQNRDLALKIKNKFKIKNTCGYGLNSFIDFSDPIEIIAHLMIGSEGTLAFISEVTLETVSDLAFKATTFLLFNTMNEACAAIPVFEAEKVDSAELMDAAALKSVKDLPGIPFDTKELNLETAALLVEISAENKVLLEAKQKSLSDKLNKLSIKNKVSFTFDPLQRARIWKIRKGLFPTGCKNREAGSTIIIEDINFPVESLAAAVNDIQLLLKRYNYSDSFIWGHALSGNIHFVLTQKFDNQLKINNYDHFMQDLVKLVIDRYGGSLKAEHGTGRNMAPFVEYEWGSEAYAVMKELKNIFDPQNLVNPGVLLNGDSRVHLKNIKNINSVHEKIDKCTDCGFCETVCPSKDLTLTPRQRISLFRKELQSASFNAHSLKQLSKKFQYTVEQTCAVDGMCQTECPVDINVGELIKEMRFLRMSKAGNWIASFIARNFNGVTQILRLMLKTIDIVRKILGEKLFNLFNTFLSVISFGVLPKWHYSFPQAAKIQIKNRPLDKKSVLYFPTCVNRIFGNYHNSKQQKTLADTIENVLHNADLKLKTINNFQGHCCGMAFASKGYFKQGRQMSEKLYAVLSAELKTENIPVLFDSSPCAIHMNEYIKNNNKKALNISDPVDFIYSHLKNKISFKKISNPLALHPVCSIKKHGSSERLIEIAEMCAEKVIVTEPVGCCGFAGDRGINFPELNKSALADLPPAILSECDSGYSSSRMCEVGLTRETGIPFYSIFNLLEKSIK